MEWVETVAKTVDAAKEAALDQLGVHEDDAEFEVLEEPRPGLFGRMRGEARVRARVRPVRPRPKLDRRQGRRRRGERGERGERTDRPERGERGQRNGRTRGDRTATVTTGAPGRERSDDDDEGGSGASPARRRRRRGGRGPGSGTQDQQAAGAASSEENPEGEMSDVTVEEQGRIVHEFVDGLVDAFDLEATVEAATIDEETVEVQVNGPDLGLLIGPKGATLQAVHELARTVVQRSAPGTHHGRVRIDVAGYRQRRREALERFTRQVAEDVLRTGKAKALEPMNPADRKVVHDTVNELEGVRTTSEGEEPRRRVVIAPAASAEPPAESHEGQVTEVSEAAEAAE
jgi:spoIIIJ-associated protein